MSIRCRKCGQVYPDKTKFCGKCGTMFDAEDAYARPEPGPSASSRAGTGPRPAADFRASPNRMAEGIALGIGEELVKRYRIGRYTLRQGEISVIVTNKRVIRFEESNWFGMQTNRMDEVNIDAVQGTSCTMQRSISILGLCATLILLIFGILSISQGSGYSGYYRYGGGFSLGTIFGLSAVFAALLIIVNSLRPTLRFQIHGAVGAPVLQTEVNTLGRIFGRNYASFVFQFKPTAETATMLKEIGACVYDLKTLGDAAIEKWR